MKHVNSQYGKRGTAEAFRGENETREGQTLLEIHAKVYSAVIAVVRVYVMDILEEKENDGKSRKGGVPPWERRINKQIQELRYDMNGIVQYEKGNKNKSQE
mgnify:CR=1 FL=1